MGHRSRRYRFRELKKKKARTEDAGQPGKVNAVPTQSTNIYPFPQSPLRRQAKAAIAAYRDRVEPPELPSEAEWARAAACEGLRNLVRTYGGATVMGWVRTFAILEGEQVSHE